MFAILTFVLGLDSFGEAFTNGVWNTCHITQKVALIVIPIGIIAQVGVAILNFFTGRESQWSLHHVFQCIIIFFFVTCYVPTMKLIEGTINTIEGYIRDSGSVTMDQVAYNSQALIYDDQNAYKAIVNKIKAQDPTLVNDLQNLKAKEEPSVWDVLVKNVKDAVESAITQMTIDIPLTVFNLISRGITGIIRFLVWFLQTFLVAALLIVGPLAAMVHTIPIFGKGGLNHWFKSLISIKFWGITMAVIDILMDQYLLALQTHAIQAQGFLSVISSAWGASVLVNIAFIILFIMTPKITSWYVGGHTDSGMSAMIAAGSSVANVASGAAKVGGAVATGGMTAGASMAGGMFGGSNVQQAQLLQTFQQLTKAMNNMANSANGGGNNGGGNGSFMPPKNQGNNSSSSVGTNGFATKK